MDDEQPFMHLIKYRFVIDCKRDGMVWEDSRKKI